MPAQTFQSILAAAVAELAETGYVSEDRLAFWQRRLREAAEAVMMSDVQLEQMLRDSLVTTYRRLVDQGVAYRHHPQVAKGTIDRVRPKLRAELDRRILAAADLIKLDRKNAVEQTLRRFAGWSTSIPAGGATDLSGRAQKASIGKALKQLPYERRRLLIDQGHKLVASIHEIIAVDGGAIAGEWNSHWREAGYNFRPAHKVRDKRIYLVRGNWAQEKGLVKPGPDGYTDSITKCAEEPFCRCYMRWFYNLAQLLPFRMLTPKGEEALEAARARRAA